MIYLDNASTTKVDKRVIEAMLPYFDEIYGNASSNHKFGEAAKLEIDNARKIIADFINARETEIIFTSGATESINLALKGYVESNFEKGNHIVTVKTEHKAILATCDYLESKGVEVTYLDVDKNGQISLEQLKGSIRTDTLLVCVMLVNNETGIIHPIEDIGGIVKDSKAKLFCDATQAIGKILIDVEESNIDLLCFSGHKLNGPKGIGILYKKNNIELTPLIHGGGQENGVRGGTYNTPLIVGLAKAIEISVNDFEVSNRILQELNDFACQEFLKIQGAAIIGEKTSRINNILNLYIPKINAEIFINKVIGIALSNGSACTSQIIEGSHVLKAMGISDIQSQNHIRFSFDKNNTLKQIRETIEAINIELGKTAYA